MNPSHRILDGHTRRPSAVISHNRHHAGPLIVRLTSRGGDSLEEAFLSESSSDDVMQLLNYTNSFT